MTPAARLQAAIEILEAVDQDRRPAEQTVSEYLRKRRYIGAKDRRAITSLAYGVLRHRARLGWHLEQVGSAQSRAADFSGRAALLAYLVLAEEESPESLGGLCDGQRYGPSALSEAERATLQRLQGKAMSPPTQPDHVAYEMPGWLMPSLERALGARLGPELTALSQEAPLDLRCNTLKAGRHEALAALTAEGIEAETTALSPLGLRIHGRRAVQASKAFRDGLVEIQDEGSQLAALLCDAGPGMAVADVCAGAGGKTLALAAAMAGQGRLLASDRDPGRLERAAARFRRAGADFIERRILGNLGGVEDLDQVKDLVGAFDRVLVDAPCSGTGSWRRQPDARWRLTQADLARYRASQQQILSAAAPLVRPGGRLIYVTCSLLAEENEDQVQAFLESHPSYAVHPVAEVWDRVVAAPCPADGPFLALTPARHGTDGFFVAILDRQGPV